jgi:hypothetical protein
MKLINATRDFSSTTAEHKIALAADSRDFSDFSELSNSRPAPTRWGWSGQEIKELRSNKVLKIVEEKV